MTVGDSYLLARQSGLYFGQAQEHSVRRRCDGACTQQLVQQCLGAIAGCGCKVGFEGRRREEGVWVVGQEEPEVECVGSRFLHRDGEFGRAF